MSLTGPGRLGPGGPVLLGFGALIAAQIRSYWNDDWNDGAWRWRVVVAGYSSASRRADQSRRIDTSSRTAERSSTSSKLSS
jgi:hypothetical protein